MEGEVKGGEGGGGEVGCSGEEAKGVCVCVYVCGWRGGGGGRENHLPLKNRPAGGGSPRLDIGLGCMLGSPPSWLLLPMGWICTAGEGSPLCRGPRG